MRTVLILNPLAGASALADHENRDAPDSCEDVIMSSLRAYGIEPEVRHTTLEDPGAGLAKQAVQEKVDLVIAAGGDGTIHSVATSLIGSKSTLGIIAMGTMNNLAHSLGIPEEIEDACAAIATGETHAVDVGKINGQPFLEAAGIGIEAAIFPAAEEVKSPGIFSSVSGVIKGLYKLFTFKPETKLKISFDEYQRRSYKAIQVTICNSPYYGARLQIASDILMDDGLLDVVIYKNFSKLEYIRHAISISQGRRPFHRNIRHRRVKSMRVIADPPVDIQADGVAKGVTPASISIEHAALQVRVPQIEGPGIHDQAGIEEKLQPITGKLA